MNGVDSKSCFTGDIKKFEEGVVGDRRPPKAPGVIWKPGIGLVGENRFPSVGGKPGVVEANGVNGTVGDTRFWSCAGVESENFGISIGGGFTEFDAETCGVDVRLPF